MERRVYPQRWNGTRLSGCLYEAESGDEAQELQATMIGIDSLKCLFLTRRPFPLLLYTVYLQSSRWLGPQKRLHSLLGEIDQSSA